MIQWGVEYISGSSAFGFYKTFPLTFTTSVIWVGGMMDTSGSTVYSQLSGETSLERFAIWIVMTSGSLSNKPYRWMAIGFNT